MDRAERVAKEHSADLALATDPDADRLGGLIPDGHGGYRYLTGNEICSLSTWFKLDQLTKPEPDAALASVTQRWSQLTSYAHRAPLRRASGQHLLVGFKNMAEVLRQLEETGSFEDVQARRGFDSRDRREPRHHGHAANSRTKTRRGVSIARLSWPWMKAARSRMLDRLHAIARQFGLLPQRGLEHRDDRN